MRTTPPKRPLKEEIAHMRMLLRELSSQLADSSTPAEDIQATLRLIDRCHISLDNFGVEYAKTLRLMQEALPA